MKTTDKWKLLQLWLALALLWCGAAAWWQWDNLTRKPWTLDWNFSFWGHGPPKTQVFAAEILVLPPLVVLAAGLLFFWLASRDRR